MTRTSHDWSPISWTCVECGVSMASIDAGLACRPSTDDSGLPSDCEPPAEIDCSAITRGIVG